MGKNEGEQEISEQEAGERDRLLRFLLNTPPHQRPKRERGKRPEETSEPPHLDQESDDRGECK